jgi:PPOX class F420-dependent enzyme/OxyR family protein
LPYVVLELAAGVLSISAFRVSTNASGTVSVHEGFPRSPWEPGHVGGHDFAKRKEFRDVQQEPRVAFVVDDVASINPWKARGIEMRGETEILGTRGMSVRPGFDPEMFRIHVKHVVSWRIE